MVKNMVKRKNILLVAVGLLVCIGLIVNVSYAIWHVRSDQTDFNIAGSKCFKLTLTDKSDSINLKEQTPTTDEEGLKSVGYSFTIKNTCNTYATYQVNLEDLISETKRLSNMYIKVSLNNSNPLLLTDYDKVTPTLSEADNSFKLTSGSLAPKGSVGDSVDYTLKLWMDYDTPALDEVMNATFASKITVVASYIEEENLNNNITISYVSNNSSYSNQGEEIKITGISTNYDIIEYSFDNVVYNKVKAKGKKVVIDNIFTEEKEVTVYLKDEVGNIKEEKIILSKLDQTGPEIKGVASETWGSVVPISINIKDNKSGLKEYQISEKEEIPSTWKSISGNEVDVTEEVTSNGIYYIYAKDVLDNISHTSVTVSKIDLINPALSVSVSDTWAKTNTISMTFKDADSGLAGYNVTESDIVPSTWESISGASVAKTKEVANNGIYYVWVKDAVGNTNYEKIAVSKVDTTAPNGLNVTYAYNLFNTKSYSASGYSSNAGPSGTWISSTNDPIIDFGNVTSIKNISGAFIELDTPLAKDITVQVFYGKNTSYNETNSVYGTLKAGAKKIQLELPTNDYTHVRFDIGTEAGLTYKINNLGIIALSEQWSNDNVVAIFSAQDSQSGVDHYEWYESNAWTQRAIDYTNIPTITYTATRNESIKFRAADKADNYSSEVSSYVKIDKNKPTVNFSVSTGNGTASINASSSSDTNSGIAKYEYSVDNGTYYTSSTATYNFTGLSHGSHTFNVRVTDNAGNVSTVSKTASITVTYTISYNANGGSGAPASQTKTHGVNLTLSSTKPTKSGYTFLGWSTSSSATNASYSAGGTYSTNSNTTLYAVWQLSTLDIFPGNSMTPVGQSGYSWIRTFSQSSSQIIYTAREANYSLASVFYSKAIDITNWSKLTVSFKVTKRWDTGPGWGYISFGFSNSLKTSNPGVSNYYPDYCNYGKYWPTVNQTTTLTLDLSGKTGSKYFEFYVAATNIEIYSIKLS